MAVVADRIVDHGVAGKTVVHDVAWHCGWRWALTWSLVVQLVSEEVNSWELLSLVDARPGSALGLHCQPVQRNLPSLVDVAVTYGCDNQVAMEC